MRTVTLVLPCSVSGKGPGNEKRTNRHRSHTSEINYLEQKLKKRSNTFCFKGSKPVMSIPTISQGASTFIGRTVLARFLFLSVCWQVLHTFIWNSYAKGNIIIIMSHWCYQTTVVTTMCVPSQPRPWWSPASSTCSGSCGQSSFGPGDDRCHWSGSREIPASSSQPLSPPPSSLLSWVPHSTACHLECRTEWKVGHAIKTL